MMLNFFSLKEKKKVLGACCITLCALQGVCVCVCTTYYILYMTDRPTSILMTFTTFINFACLYQTPPLRAFQIAFPTRTAPWPGAPLVQADP